jgi:phage-related protein/SLT domain-containing protein
VVSAGSVSLRVRPDVSQFFTDLSAQLRARGTSAVQVAIRIERSSLAQFRAQVANLTRRVILPVVIQIDRPSIGYYRAQVANLTRQQQLNVNVNLRGDRDAQARLARLAQNRTARIRVDVDRNSVSSAARSTSGLLSRITSAAGSALGAIGGLASKVALLGSAASLVGPLVGVLAAIAPAAAVAVPAVVALGSAFGAIKLGTSGLGDAFKEAFAPASAGAAKAVSATNAVANAQRSLARAQVSLKRTAQDSARAISDAQERVKDAQRDVKDAEVQAARQRVQAARAVQDAQRSLRDAVEAAAEAQKDALKKVAEAERDLLDVKKDALKAEESLADARKQAAQDLLDLQDQLTQSTLDERDAQLNLQEAQEELDKVKARGALSTQREQDEAQLRVDQATFALKQQQEGHKALQQEVEKASKAGVEGSDRVKDAQDNLAKAQQQVADKAKAVKDAETDAAKVRRDAAESVADAQQDLKDAQQAQADAAVEGARRIKDAQDAVKDAQQGVTDAQVAGARAMEDANNAVADASRAVAEAQRSQNEQTASLTENFSKLSPNAQAFVTAVKGLKSAWDAMQLGVQDRLFAGIGSRLSDVGSRVIPILRGGLEGTAGVLNRMAKGALTAVDNMARTGMLRKIFDGATESLKPLEKAPGQIVTAFGQIAVAAQPAFQKITTGLAGVITKVTDKLGKAFESGSMQKAINTAVDLLGDLMDVGKNVFSILGDIFMAGEGTGGGTIGVLKTITSEISKITSSPEVQGGLKALFSVMGELAKTVAPLLGTALKFVGQIFEKLGPPVEILVKALGDALEPVIDALGPVLVILADVLGNVLVAISPLLPVIGDLIASALKPLGPVLKIVGDLIEKLAPVIAELADSLGPILTPIVEGLGSVLGELVSQYADMFLQVLKDLTPIIPDVIGYLIQLGESLGQILEALAPLLPQLMMLGAQFITQLLPALIPLIPPLLQLTEMFLKLATFVILKIVIPAIQALVDFAGMMRDKLQPFIDAVKHVTEWIHDKFQWLSDKLVGHSIIPDMIRAIRAWFDKGRQWFAKIWDAVWDNTIGRAISGAKSVGERVSGFAKGIRDRFNDAKSWASDRWKGMWSSVSDRTKSSANSVRDRVRDFKNAVIGFFRSAIDGIRNQWSKLQDIAKNPVKFMIKTVFNDGLRKVWNATAAKLPGIKTIPAMAVPKGFADGGVLPGYTPGKDVHRFVSPTGGVLDLSGGESIMRPEVTRAVGSGGIHALNAAARQGGVAGVQALLANGLPHRAFWGGGIWDAITDNPVTNAVKGAVGKGADLLGKGVDWARGGVAKLAEKALKEILGVTSLKVDTSNQIWSSLVGNVPVMLASKMVDWLKGKEDEGAGSSASIKGYKPSAGVRQWSGVVLQALKEVGQPASLLDTTLRRMQQESGGNPTIVNKWDSNWLAGYPSVGLMQVIRPTYQAYAGKYRNKGPFSYGVSVDPLANVYSSMRYALSAYGSLSRAYNRAGGYDSGGWLPPGITPVVNQTGKPEAILNPAQWDAMITLANQAKRDQAGGHTVIVNNPPQPTGEKQVADVLHRMDLLGR